VFGCLLSFGQPKSQVSENAAGQPVGSIPSLNQGRYKELIVMPIAGEIFRARGRRGIAMQVRSVVEGQAKRVETLRLPSSASNSWRQRQLHPNFFQQQNVMSTAAKATFATTTLSAIGIVIFVHRQQKTDQAVSRTAEDVKILLLISISGHASRSHT
jgi:hypothetical protein